MHSHAMLLLSITPAYTSSILLMESFYKCALSIIHTTVKLTSVLIFILDSSKITTWHKTILAFTRPSFSPQTISSTRSTRGLISTVFITPPRTPISTQTRRYQCYFQDLTGQVPQVQRWPLMQPVETTLAGCHEDWMNRRFTYSTE